MKTLLNLLPEERKEAIRHNLHVRFLLWQVFLLFCLECFYLVILFGIYFVLNFQLQTFQGVSANTDDTTSSAQQKMLNQYEKKFRETNEAVEMVSRIEYDHLHFTRIFTLLDKLLPENILIDHLRTKEYGVFLSGTADTRDHLLLFEARLKESACVESVNMPISNLFSQENIDFQMDFTVKPECLKQS